MYQLLNAKGSYYWSSLQLSLKKKKQNTRKNNPSQCYSLPALISPLSTWRIINFKKPEIDPDKDTSLKSKPLKSGYEHSHIIFLLKMGLGQDLIQYNSNDAISGNP